MDGLTIGSAAAFLGITPKTIRHYERLKLVAEPSRNASGNTDWRDGRARCAYPGAMESRASNEAAARLRDAVLQDGRASRELRESALAGDGRDAASAALVERIRTEAYRVTDGDISGFRNRVGSDQAAFEVVLAASIGAGLERRAAALDALEEALHASS